MLPLKTSRFIGNLFPKNLKQIVLLMSMNVRCQANILIRKYYMKKVVAPHKVSISGSII